MILSDNFKKGDALVYATNMGSNLTTGVTYYFVRWANKASQQIYVSSAPTGGSNYYAYLGEFESPNVTLVDIEKSIQELTEQIELLEQRKAFMKETKVTLFNNDEFKAYQILKELNLGDIKQAKAIVKILNS